jgi:hypothetical protein
MGDELRRLLSRASGPASWGAGFAAIAAAVLMFDPPQEGATTDSGLVQGVAASGYNAIIERIFSARGRSWLRLDESGDPAAPVVSLSPEALQYAPVKAFYRLSFLKHDILSNDASLWRIEGGRVMGVSQSVHAIRLPFTPQSLWRGDLAFRNDVGSDPVLLGAGRMLVLSPAVPGQDPVQADIDAFEPAPFSPTDASAQSVQLLVDGAPAARIFRIGDSVPVLRVDSDAVRITLDGAMMQADPRKADYARLASDGQLVVERVRDGRRVEFAIRSAGGALTQSRPLGGRARDPLVGGLAPAFERAMNRAVAAGAAGPDTRVTTTLDSLTQARIQQALEAYCEAGRARTDTHGPFRASVTVMDLASGEVLALASYPRTQDQVGGPVSRRLAERLVETNHNFERLSVGSAAKPIFASAVLERFPELRNLVIAGGRPEGEIGNLFGVALHPSLKEDAIGDPRIDFTTFLAKSSNRYAALLMLLAASRHPFDPGELYAYPTYDLMGRRTRLPPLAFADQARPGWRGLNFISLISDPDEPHATKRFSAWPEWLDYLYDLPLYQGSTLDRSGRAGGGRRALGGTSYDLSIWRALADQLGEKALGGFGDSGVSPERERLNLGVMDSFRVDYLSLILGGGRSQWTTIKLAEVYGRIVSGRRISARLVRSVDGAASQELSGEPQEWNPAVRRALLTGLEGVSAHPGGTAYSPRMTRATERLAAMAATRGGLLAVYSKTGTPTLDAFAPTPAGAAVEDLFSIRLLRSVSGGAKAGVAAGPGRMVVPQDPMTIAEAGRAIDTSEAARIVLAQWGVSAEDVARYLAGYNSASTPAQKARWLRIDRGRPSRL